VPLSLPDPDQVIGIDAGLKDFAVLSDEDRIPNPRFYRKAQRRLRRAQRTFCRRQKGSNRKAKAKQKVARLHQKTADQRKDFLHKESTKIIKRFAGVCIEDLCVKGLARTKLSKSVLDAAHGEFRWMLEYKAAWHRRHCVRVDRFYPSTKTCNKCGHVNHALTLKDREWICPVCGASHDRDINAARNVKDEGLRILTAGHAGSLTARGACRRPRNGGAMGDEPRISTATVESVKRSCLCPTASGNAATA
jgi:putative transposase